jgi:sulfate adenylyltransferase subunit 1
MVTGASNSDLVIILVDARKGVIEQTKRHSIISWLLGLPHVVVAVNKMDLVNYDESVYNKIVSDYKSLQQQLGIKEVTCIPISALRGENVVEGSKNMPWYKGETLINILENIQVEKDIDLTNARFPVQYVIRPQTLGLPDYRGYAGKITSGIYKKGDKVKILPAGLNSTIKAIEKDGREVEEAFAPQSVIIHLENDIDVGRGDVIVKADDEPRVTQDLDVMLCWMDTKSMEVGSKYLIQHNNKQIRCSVKAIGYKLDVNTLEKQGGVSSAQLNDVCKVSLKTARPLVIDGYSQLRTNGAAILIDETSNLTVGACIIQ